MRLQFLLEECLCAAQDLIVLRQYRIESYKGDCGINIEEVDFTAFNTDDDIHNHISTNNEVCSTKNGRLDNIGKSIYENTD